MVCGELNTAAIYTPVHQCGDQRSELARAACTAVCFVDAHWGSAWLIWERHFISYVIRQLKASSVNYRLAFNTSDTILTNC